jgi:hypothetical protein
LAIEAKHSVHFRHNRVNRLKLPGVLVGFGQRRECHEARPHIGELAVQSRVKAEHPSPDDCTQVEPAALVVCRRSALGESTGKFDQAPGRLPLAGRNRDSSDLDLPPADIDCVVAVDAFEFAMKTEKQAGRLIAKPFLNIDPQ